MEGQGRAREGASAGEGTPVLQMQAENETSLRIASASPPDRYLSPKLENDAQY